MGNFLSNKTEHFQLTVFINISMAIMLLGEEILVGIYQGVGLHDGWWRDTTDRKEIIGFYTA